MRCGQLYYASGSICAHTGTRAYNIDTEHAVRVQARYALGKLHNLDHDTTLYVDHGFDPLRGPG